MSKKARQRRATPLPTEAGATRAAGSPVEQVRPWLLGATVALVVARVLLPSEGIERTGEGIPLVMAALVLGTIWLALAAWARPPAVSREKTGGGEGDGAGGAEGDSPIFAAQKLGQSPAQKLGEFPMRDVPLAASHGESPLRFTLVDAAVLGLLAMLAVAAVEPLREGNARAAWNVLWQWVGLGMGYFLLRQLVRSARDARALIAVMIALGAMLAAYGLWQYAWEFPKLRAEYARDPDAVLRRSGLWYPPGSVEREHFANRLGSVEPLGTFALANSLAGYLAPWLVVLLGIGLAARPSPPAPLPKGEGRSTPSPPTPLPKGEGRSGPSPTGALAKGQRRARWAAVAAAGGPIGLCLVLTKSRSAWVATVVGVVLLAVWAWRGRRRLGWKLPGGVALAGAAVVGLAWAAGGLDAQVIGEATKSLGYRVQYWRSTATMIAEHPLVGCGPGQFQDVYTAYKLPEASEEVADPHNFLLEVWAIGGTPALVALLVMLGGFAWTVAKGPGPEELARPEGNAHATWWVLGGALAGVLAAWPLGLLGSGMPSLAILWLGLPLGIATIGCLGRWIDRGQFSAALAAVGLVVLLVNLLAAGGIGFPGVAGSFWVFLALGQVSVGPHPQPLSQKARGEADPHPQPLSQKARGEVDPHPQPRSQRARGVGRAGASIGALGCAMLVVLCYQTGYRPVLMAQRHVNLALARPEQAEAQLRAAAEADPLWPQPHNHLATLAFARWQETNAEEDLRQFERETERALERGPRASPAWEMAGDRYFEAFQRTGAARLREKALDAYRQAVRLYPANATCRAKLALACLAAGDEDGFQHERATALRLDEQNPHREKAIPVKLRTQLMRSTQGP